MIIRGMFAEVVVHSSPTVDDISNGYEETARQSKEKQLPDE